MSSLDVFERKNNPNLGGDYYYVDSEHGDDGNDGRSLTTAKATLGAGFALMTGGDTLFIRAPETHPLREQLDNETWGRYTLRGLDGLKWHIYGSTRFTTGWTDAGGGVWSRAVASVGNSETNTPVTGATVVDLVDSDGYQWILQSDGTSTTPTQGRFGYTAGTLYVRLPADQNPNSHIIEVSVHTHCICQRATNGRLIVHDCAAKYAAWSNISAGRVRPEAGGSAFAVDQGHLELYNCSSMYASNAGKAGIASAWLFESLLISNCNAERNGVQGIGLNSSAAPTELPAVHLINSTASQNGRANGADISTGAPGILAGDKAQLFISDGRYFRNPQANLRLLGDSVTVIDGGAAFDEGFSNSISVLSNASLFIKDATASGNLTDTVSATTTGTVDTSGFTIVALNANTLNSGNDYYYVDSEHGDDSNDGRSLTTAKATLNAGFALMTGGDTLFIRAPETHPLREQLDNETWGRYTLRGLDGLKWHIYGSTRVTTGWTDAGGGVWSRAVASVGNSETNTPVTGATVVDLVDSDGYQWILRSAGASATPGQGYFGYTAGTLYVRLPADQNPNSYIIEVSVHSHCICQRATNGRLIVHDCAAKYAAVANISAGRVRPEGGGSAFTVDQGHLELYNCSSMYASNDSRGGIVAAWRLQSLLMSNCNAERNGKDGFGLSSFPTPATNPVVHAINCTASENGRANGANIGSSDQGITPHDAIQLYITGGRYFRNPHGNLFAVGDSVTVIDGGAEFDDGMLYGMGFDVNASVVVKDARASNNANKGFFWNSTGTADVSGLVSGLAEGNGVADDIP